MRGVGFVGMSDRVKIENQDDLEAWLTGKDGVTRFNLASRAALRSLPNIYVNPFTEHLSIRKILYLPAFQTIRASWMNSLGHLDEENQINSHAIAMATPSLFRNHKNTASKNALFSIAFSLDDFGIDEKNNTISTCESISLSIESAIISNEEYGRGETSNLTASKSSWSAVEADVSFLIDNQQALIPGTIPIWRNSAPEWATKNWHTLRSILLGAEGEDWDVWADWYEARLSGSQINLILEEAILLIPDEIWAAGPKVANAEIRRLMQVHAPKSKRRPRLTIEEAIALAERDERGFSVVNRGGVFVLDHSATAEREQVEADLPMMRKRAARLLRAFERANFPMQQDCAEDIRDFIIIIEGDYEAIAKEARNLWNISIGFGSAFERDSEERKREGELLTADQRAAVDIFLATSANFVRLFPAVRKMDSENRLHRNIENRHSLTLALIESSVQHEIVLKADADILLALAQIANAATQQSAKAANALDATQTNLLRRVALLGAAGVGAVAQGALTQVGVDLESQLQLSERSVDFIHMAENDIRAFILSLPSDIRAPMSHAIDAILGRDDA